MDPRRQVTQGRVKLSSRPDQALSTLCQSEIGPSHNRATAKKEQSPCPETPELEPRPDRQMSRASEEWIAF
jgi:hypothetical protein